MKKIISRPIGLFAWIVSGVIVPFAPTYAVDYWWDANGGSSGTGGTGIWDISSALWREGSNTGTLTSWPNDVPSTSRAWLDGTAGVVTLANGQVINLQNITFRGSGDWYIAAGDSASHLAFSGSDNTIDLGGGRSVYLNTAISLSAGGTLAVTGGAAILGIGRNGVSEAQKSASFTLDETQSATFFSSAARGDLRVGQDGVASSTVGTQGVIDVGAGQLNAWVTRVALGVRNNSGASSGDVTSRVDFGTNAASSLDIRGGDSSLIGGLFLGGGTYSGTVISELILGAGNHRIEGLAGASPLLRLGRIDGTNNGTNVAHVDASLKITGGTTEIIQGDSSGNAILMAERSTSLNANTTVTAELAITGGALSVSGGDIYGGGGTSIITLDGGTLDMNGRQIGRATTGRITTLNMRSGTLWNVAQINSGGDWSKTGTGTLTLAGTNAYTGVTTVETGELVINGIKSGAGNIHVDAGARISGSGTVAGATLISGIHAPGNSPGTQTFSTLGYQSGATLEWELITNSEDGRGVNFDAINVSGNLTIATGVSATLIFDTAGSLVDWGDSFWSEDHRWLLYSVGGVLDAPVLFESVSWTADSLGGVLTSGVFGFYSEGHDVYLSYEVIPVVPEPSMVFSLLGGATLMVLLRRRRA